jgi:hypothetical protein
MVDSLCTVPKARGISCGVAEAQDVAAKGARGCSVSNSSASLGIKIGVPVYLVTQRVFMSDDLSLSLFLRVWHWCLYVGQSKTNVLWSRLPPRRLSILESLPS